MASPSTATRTSSLRRSAVSPPPVANGIAKGASARSAVPSRVAAGPLSNPAKRLSRGSPTPGDSSSDERRTESREALLASLKRETSEKEDLTLRVQNYGDEVAGLRKENDNLIAALTAAEQRVAELDADQIRMEQETETKMDVIEKLRAQIREIEKEKRDATRRYNEQASTFEAERQSHYDTEQHLRSRIQSLTQARKRSPAPRSRNAAPPRSPSILQGELEPSEDETDDPSTRPGDAESPKASSLDIEEDSEPAEMTSLRLELSTLSVSHTSTQNTLQLLQTELADLKRVNNELQEENESYNILLRERTLTGQFDLLRGGTISDDDMDEQRTEGGSLSFMEERAVAEGRPPSIRSRTTLDVVPEADEAAASAAAAMRQRANRRPASPSGRSRRGAASSLRNGSESPLLGGENLGDLPISGPGLDLAAELGRAENRDTPEGSTVAPTMEADKLQAKKESEDVRALKGEVKALKDANKALSLYASKILDRIIAQEGFENVLAVDYDAKRKPSTAAAPQPPPKEQPRPKSSFFPARSNTVVPAATAPAPTPTAPPLGRTSSETAAPTTPSAVPMATTASAPAALSSSDKRARRGLSMDWKGLSFGGLFGGSSTTSPPEEPKNDKLRPLTLRASVHITGQSTPPASILSPPIGGSFNGGSAAVPGARKVGANEEEEDEEDRKERERMLATLKLMGIDKPETPAPVLQRTQSVMSASSASSSPNYVAPATPGGGRIPFFTRFGRSADASSVPATPAGGSSPNFSQQQQGLTAEALDRAEAESALANLDAQEKAQSAEYAKPGPKVGGGFTEITSPKSLSEGFMKRTGRSGKSGSASGGRVSMENGSVGSGASAGGGDRHSRAGSVNTIFSAGAMSVDVETLGGPPHA